MGGWAVEPVWQYSHADAQKRTGALEGAGDFLR
jgi:hypothetical protein